MSNRTRRALSSAVAVAPLLCIFSAAPAAAQPAPQMCGDGTTFTVNLPGTSLGIDDSNGLFRSVNVPATAPADSITLPNGCRLYVLLVSGYNQNHDFDRITFYKVAEFAAANDGYVHVAWWNNLLAPYMGRPLHPVPVTIDRLILPDVVIDPNPGGFHTIQTGIGVFFPDNFLDLPKANPASDRQFQSDATLMVQAIKANNPDALIVVVGHSMGGDAAARLGRNRDLPIDLLALIDPTNNQDRPYGISMIDRTFNWTRWRATHDFLGYRQRDCVSGPLGFCIDFDDRLLHVEYRCLWLPYQDHPPSVPSRAPLACPVANYNVHGGTLRNFGPNIRRLYHRWQFEGLPPYDFFASYRFGYPAPLSSTLSGPNYQHGIEPNLIFGTDPHKTCAVGPDPNRPAFNCNATDGHNEIIGYRPTPLFQGGPEPVGLGLANWPASLTATERRARLVQLGPSWAYRPSDPDTCLVCDDINTIIQQLLDEQPDPEPPADVTAPFSTSTLLPDPNIAGWHVDDVVVLLEATDNEGGSGVKEIEYTLSGAQSEAGVIAGNTASITVTAEGYTTITYFSRDEAGNVEEPHSIEVRIDKTPPSIDIQSPSDGAFILNDSVPAAYSCADAFSGVDACAGTVAAGADINTSAVGSHVFQVTATDLAGNQTTLEVSYSVQYAFSGFASPIQAWPVANPAVAGKAVVLKFSLADAAGNRISDPGVLTSAESYAAACQAPPDGVPQPEMVDTPVSQFTYNPNGGLFAFAWKTQAGWTGCRILQLTLNDGTVHSVLFSFNGSE